MPNDAITPFILAVPQADFKHWNLKEKRQSMRKLICAINLTLDGCCDHTTTLGIYAHSMSEDMLTAQGDMLEAMMKPPSDSVN